MVYIDNFNARFGRMKMCHMIADTHEELITTAISIGVNTKWIQYKGSYNEHFDISLGKKSLAIKNGAKEIGFREMSERINKRK